MTHQTRFRSRSRPCEIVASACFNPVGLENFTFILPCKSCDFVLFNVHSSSCTVHKPRSFVIVTTLDEWNVHFVPRFTMFCVLADKSPTERPKKKPTFFHLNFVIFWGTIAATSPKRLLGSWQPHPLLQRWHTIPRHLSVSSNLFGSMKKRRSSSGASSSGGNAREDQATEHQVQVELQEKIKQRSIKFRQKCREDQAAEHQVHVEMQEKIKQRSIKFMQKCKRRSSSGASSSGRNAREDQAAEHQVQAEMQEKIRQRSIKFMWKCKRSKRRSSSGASGWVVVIPPPTPPRNFPKT